MMGPHAFPHHVNDGKLLFSGATKKVPLVPKYCISLEHYVYIYVCFVVWIVSQLLYTYTVII